MFILPKTVKGAELINSALKYIQFSDLFGTTRNSVRCHIISLCERHVETSPVTLVKFPHPHGYLGQGQHGHIPSQYLWN